MLVNLKEIEEHKPLLINTEVPVLSYKVLVCGQITKDENYILKATLRLEAAFDCDFCLKPVKKTLTVNVDEHLEEDITTIIPVISANVFENLPMQILCSESCKGLCKVCGTDLNENSCSCNSLSKDSPFSKLLELDFET